MNHFFKKVIEETFASKKQQKFFYAKASDKSIPKKERKKWGKWASEFSSKTDFDKIPEKAEQDVEEVVDEKGNIKRGEKDGNLATKFTGSNSTTDQAAATGFRMMGMYGIAGTVQAPKRFWGEADMSKSLGYDDTLGDDESYKEAYKHFTKELGLSDEEAKERLSAMGYIPGEKELVRLVENPRKFMEDYIQSALDKKNTNNDVLKKDNEKKELNPLVQKQLNSLKSTIEDNNLDLDQILDYLKNEQ
jgi:hypothetical protein